MKSPVLTDLVHNYTYHNYTDHIWWNHQLWLTWYTIIHIRIIETISGEITSSDWPDTQSYINYRDHIWWNHQFWLTWYTLYISSIIETISGEITSSDGPDTQLYISELYRTYLVKSPVLTDLVHNHTYQNYTEHIWWNHQFWLTWYTIIHQL